MSIRMKNGRPYVEVYDPALGRKRHVSPKHHGMDFRGLKGRALAAAAKTLEQRALDALANPTTTVEHETVASFVARWTDDYKGSNGRPRAASTLEGHRQNVRRLGEDFPDRTMESVTRREARAWAQQHPYRLASVRLMFNDALDDQLVTHNPFARLGIGVPNGRADLITLERDEVHLLADLAAEIHGEVYGPEVRALILWAAYTCMRPGEIFAARRSRLHGDVYDVREQFNSRVRKETQPKAGSVGEIYVPDEALDALQSVPRRLNDDLIFRTVTGKQLRNASWYHVWNPVRRAFVGKLPANHDLRRRVAEDPRDQLDLHELRHFGATYMLNELKLEPWVIAQQLRHSDDGTLVVKLYGHPKRRTAIDAIRTAHKGGNVAPIRPVSGDFGRNAASKGGQQ